MIINNIFTKNKSNIKFYINPYFSAFKIHKRGVATLALNCSSSNITTTLCVLVSHNHYALLKRFMRRATGPSFARSAFYIMDTLFNKDIQNIVKNNKHHLAESLVDLSLDDTKGIMQDKSVLLKRILGNNFDPKQIYAHFHRKTNIPVICTSNDNVDARIFSELPVLVEYHEKFGVDVKQIVANVDKVAIRMDGSKQSNHDFSVCAKVMSNDDAAISKYITYIENEPTRLLVHDEKSMGGMFAHSTSGSIGVLPYEMNKNIMIPINNITNIWHLLTHDLNSLNSIRDALKNDGIFGKFKDTLLEANNILTKSDPKDPVKTHNNYQGFLWNEVQRHPSYNRTLSYILPKEIIFTPQTGHALAFEIRFKQLLSDPEFTKSRSIDTLYNIDKQGDYLLVCRAMLRAYKETCNPMLGDLLKKIVHEDKIFTFNARFANDLAYIIKNDPWFQ